MSRSTRIVLALLVSLAVIVGIYTSVEGASLSSQPDKAGTHLVSGSQVNLDHFRGTQSGLQEYQASPQQGKGHDCNSETKTSPDD